MTSFKRFSIPMSVGGNGYIEIIARDRGEALAKLREGLGVQHVTDTHCEEYFADEIEDEGEAGEGDIEEYKSETYGEDPESYGAGQ